MRVVDFGVRGAAAAAGIGGEFAAELQQKNLKNFVADSDADADAVVVMAAYMNKRHSFYFYDEMHY